MNKRHSDGNNVAMMDALGGFGVKCLRFYSDLSHSIDVVANLKRVDCQRRCIFSS